MFYERTYKLDAESYLKLIHSPSLLCNLCLHGSASSIRYTYSPWSGQEIPCVYINQLHYFRIPLIGLQSYLDSVLSTPSRFVSQIFTSRCTHFIFPHFKCVFVKVFQPECFIHSLVRPSYNTFNPPHLFINWTILTILVMNANANSLYCAVHSFMLFLNLM